VGGIPRLTAQTQRVLLLFLADPSKPLYGLEIARQAQLQRGTLYPILARLEAAGLLTSDWEEIDPVAAGRHPRRYYSLTHEGLQQAEAVRDALMAALPSNLGVIKP